MIDSGEITVSKKTLLHVSEGIYRSAGSAIKELISNSFDANANNVSITTNYPRFEFLSIQDDGEGMQVEEFLRIVKGGIGDSLKATHDIKNGRPLIGKLGIGILAIAQICRSFTIISHHRKTKSAFKGRMTFSTGIDKIAKEVKIDETGEGYP
ncbi:MAG: ATP-binding protein, partial [Balneolaceae bacterium]